MNKQIMILFFGTALLVGAWMAFKAYEQSLAEKRHDLTIERLKDVKAGLRTLRLHCMRYPDSSAGLRSLQQTNGNECWKGPYLAEGAQFDGWGNTFVYSLDGDGFKVKSNGADQMPNTSDDIN